MGVGCLRKPRKAKARKMADCVCPHISNFEVKAWDVPDEMKKWKEDNFGKLKGGRPTALVIVGPGRYGKTE